MDIEAYLSTKFLNTAIDLLFEVGPKIVLALLLYYVGRWIILLVSKAVNKIFTKREIEPSLASFLQSFLRFFLNVMLIIMVISTLGVPATSFLAVLGAAGLAIGLALQGSLSNFAGGVLVLAFKPFKVGEVIDASGKLGKVERIDILHTTLHTFDNRAIIIPNGGLANGDIINISRLPTRRVDFSVGIAYNSDIKAARKTILAVLEQDVRILKDPEAVVKLVNLGDSSLDLSVRVWVNAEHYWDVFFDNLELIKEALDAAKISIPFPQRDVHVFKHNIE